MWKRVFIANRGEIARRVARSARSLGLEVVVAYHEDDAEAPFVREADLAYPLGGGALSETYLNVPKLVEVALDAGAQLVHPGYGFLSERADFARACLEVGLSFVGPSPELIEQMGDKASSKGVARERGFPCAPGYHGADQSLERLISEGEALGAPLMVKATHGGGGRGMRLVTELSELKEALESAAREAEAAFGEGSLLLERAILEARHVEVQVFGDSQGSVVHLGERDCTLQRRRQKVIEESPAPGLSAELRAALCEAARRLAEEVGYQGAGTVECLVTPEGGFVFCEMNTRIQVEHPVTELRYGVDLVEWQLRVAMGEPLPLSQQALDERLSSGRHPAHVIEARLYAEEPSAGYLSQAGPVERWRAPSGAGVRVDDGVGPQVSARFDAMLAKIICSGESRAHARRRLSAALSELTLIGPPSNLAHLTQLVESEPFRAFALHTKSLDEARPSSELAPRVPPPPSSRERALAALCLSLPSIEAQARGEAPQALSCDGWGSASPSWWEVRLGEGPQPTSPAELVKVSQRGARAALVSCSGEEMYLSQLSYNPALARLTYRLEGGPLRQVRAWRSPERAEVALVSAEGYERRWRDLSYERARPDLEERRAGQILAPISGVISAVHVEEGALVSPDLPLVTLEAMKLEHALFAPRHARVQELCVHEGQQVSAGHLLITLRDP